VFFLIARWPFLKLEYFSLVYNCTIEQKPLVSCLVVAVCPAVAAALQLDTEAVPTVELAGGTGGKGEAHVHRSGRKAALVVGENPLMGTYSHREQSRQNKDERKIVVFAVCTRCIFLDRCTRTKGGHVALKSASPQIYFCCAATQT
jgi:hypothetical protein